MNGRRPRTQFARLVVHADRDAVDLLFVLARVMGAEQQFVSARELDPKVGLGAAAVAPVEGCEWLAIGVLKAGGGHRVLPIVTGVREVPTPVVVFVITLPAVPAVTRAGCLGDQDHPRSPCDRMSNDAQTHLLWFAVVVTPQAWLRVATRFSP